MAPSDEPAPPSRRGAAAAADLSFSSIAPKELPLRNPVAAVLARRTPHRAMLGLGLMLCATQVCLAQGAAAAAETRDPAVLARLAQMGDLQRSLMSSTFKAETAKDELLQSGQRVQFGGTLATR